MSEPLNEWASLQTVDEVDGMLGEKRQQLLDAHDGVERAAIREDMDKLLEVRHTLGHIALEGSDGA